MCVAVDSLVVGEVKGLDLRLQTYLGQAPAVGAVKQRRAGRFDMNKPRNPSITNEALPVEIVFHPSWWHKNAGISFDEDFFYHPARRVEDERKMERELYERFGGLGPGEDRDRDLPASDPCITRPVTSSRR